MFLDASVIIAMIAGESDAASSPHGWGRRRRS
jgi:uncharacterized protein with PIN domain